jgi:hypothetical protein
VTMFSSRCVPAASWWARAVVESMLTSDRPTSSARRPWRSSPPAELRTRQRPAIGGSGWRRSVRGRTPAASPAIVRRS